MCAPLLRTLMFYSNNNLTLMILQKKMPEFYDPGILWSEHNRYFIVNSSLFEYKNADLLKLLKNNKNYMLRPPIKKTHFAHFYS